MNGLLAQTVIFSDGSVWTFLIQLAILCGAILLGNILRTFIPALRKFLIPSALIGGVLVLIFKYTPVLGGLVDSEMMQVITYHCLGLGFAAITLKTAKTKKKVGTMKIVESGIIMAGSYFIQAITGLIISLIFFFAVDCFYGAGLILPMGFGQGTGSALNWGSIFETTYEFNGGASYGLTVATIGFIVGSVIGVIYLNVKKKNGKIKDRLSASAKKTLSDYEAENEIPDADSVDKLSIQFCFVIAVYTMAYGFMCLLQRTNVKAINDLAWGLNFLWALLFGVIFKNVMAILKKKNIIKRYYVNNYLMDRISGFMFDVMIIAGVCAIDFEDIFTNWLLLVVTTVVGTIVTFFYVNKTTKYTYKNYEAESFVTNFGTVTGTVSTGIILLREIDPAFTTPAADNIVLQNLPSVILIAPLLLTMSIAVQSLNKTIIMLCVYTVLFIIYNVFLFRRKIFKKRYADIAEEVWTEDGE